MRLHSTRQFSWLITTALFSIALVILPQQVFADGGMFSTSISASAIHSLQNASVSQRAGRGSGVVGLSLPTREGGVLARMEPHEIRSPNYQLFESGHIPFTTDIRLFKGEDGSEKNGNFYRLALVRNSAAEEYHVEGFYRVRDYFYRIEPSDQGLEYVVNSISPEDVEEMLATCGAEASEAHAIVQGRIAAPAERTLKVAELLVDADFEYTTVKGGPVSAANFQIQVINAVDAIYRAQLNVRLSITYQNVWAISGDPYSSTTASGTLLTEFVNYAQANYNNAAVYDVAHLFTGRVMAGGVAGVAYVSALCGSFRYGLSEDLGSALTTYNVPVVAHEIGHNFGANHDSCGSGSNFIMCPVLVPEANTFSSASISSINVHVANSSCLSSEGGGGSNLAPELAAIGPKQVTEGTLLQFSISATDPNSDPLTYGATPLAGAALTGQSFSYTPAIGTVPAGQTSTQVAVTFSVTDGFLTDSEAVLITVNRAVAANHPPVLVNPGTQNISEGQPFVLPLSASDADGDTLVFSNVTALPAGMSFETGSGILSWNPGGNQSGSYDLTISVNDQRGGQDEESFTIVVQDTPSEPPLPARLVLGDSNNNGSADLTVFRNPTAYWYYRDLLESGYREAQFGLPGDIPLNGDWNGDKISDRAVFRPSTSTWFIHNARTGQLVQRQFGLTGDIPITGDFDGDGRYDLAVFRPLGFVIYRSSVTDTDVVVVAGTSGDLPVIADYDGDGDSDVAVYRPSNGTWRTYTSSGENVVTLGQTLDIPVPGDYNGDGVDERVVYRPATGEWIGSVGTIQFGLGGDVPVPYDYDGDGKTNLAVWRPSVALWFVRTTAGDTIVVQHGLHQDFTLRESFYYAARNTNGGGLLARSSELGNMLVYRRQSQVLYTIGLGSLTAATVPAALGSYFLRGDYDGDGVVDLAVWKDGLWIIYLGNSQVLTLYWGVAGDIPVVGDFDGDGKTDVTVFRPGNGFSTFFVIRSRDGQASSASWGLTGDLPIPGDFNGDGVTDYAVYRPGVSLWLVRDGRSLGVLYFAQWGLSGDIPVITDFDSDGRPDFTVFRPATGQWFLYRSGGGTSEVQWGLPGDFPVPGSYLGQADFAVWRPSTGTLLVLAQSGFSGGFTTGLGANDRVVGTNPSYPLQ